jgi:hypothetical protein
MTERNRATSKNLQKRKKIFDEMRMTSHWPHKPIMFSKTPRTYGKPLPEICVLDKPILNDFAKKLI